jgi:hypothetical protein
MVGKRNCLRQVNIRKTRHINYLFYISKIKHQTFN